MFPLLTLAIKFADFTVVFLGFLISGNSAESWERGEKKHLFTRLFLPLVCVCVLIAQSCPRFCDAVDWSPQASSVHRILQARILEWVKVKVTQLVSDSLKPHGK